MKNLELGQSDSETISRDYFESSVYRNILDMLGTVSNTRKELRDNWLTVGSMCGFGFHNAGNDGANGFAIKKGYSAGRNSWNRLFSKVKGNPWKMDEWHPKTFPDQSTSNKAVLNARSLNMRLVNLLATIEWELNRVHLPMVDDLRKVGLLLNDFTGDLPSHVTCGLRSDVDLEGKDRARIAAYKAQKVLLDMKTWLATMTEKIKARSEFDAAALERIAAEAEARAKEARQAEAEAAALADKERQEKAKAEAEAQELAAEQNKADAESAKETAAKAADTEYQIVTADDENSENKNAAVFLTVAGGLTALLLS